MYVYSVRKLCLSICFILVVCVHVDDEKFCKNPLLMYLRKYLFPHELSISDNPEVFQLITSILVNEEVIN